MRSGDRGQPRPEAMSSTASSMSAVEELMVFGRGAKLEGSDDSGTACLLSPRPEPSVFLPPPRVIGTSLISGEAGTSRGGDGETPKKLEDKEGAPPPNFRCARETGRLPNGQHSISGSESTKPDPIPTILWMGGEVKLFASRAGGW